MKKLYVCSLLICALTIILIGCSINSENNSERFKEKVSNTEDDVIENEIINDSNKETDNENNNQETEFALISGNSKLVLGKEITGFPKESISTTENRGDGYVWDDIVYDDIQIRVVKNTVDDSQAILEMVTTSSNYETPRGIKVGDNTETLEKAYPEYIEKDYHGDWGDYYLFSPENDIGFFKIMFYTENDVITKISVFNGIDG